MAMSNDRVHFNLPCPASTVAMEAQISAAMTALGMTPAQARLAAASEVVIICRPSQFARFLIHRCQNGGTNSFACLNAKLVSAEPDAKIIDVSKNPAAC